MELNVEGDIIMDEDISGLVVDGNGGAATAPSSVARVATEVPREVGAEAAERSRRDDWYPFFRFMEPGESLYSAVVCFPLRAATNLVVGLGVAVTVLWTGKLVGFGGGYVPLDTHDTFTKEHLDMLTRGAYR